MSAILVFLAVLALAAGWWLARQGLMVKPWLHADAAGAIAHAPRQPAAQIGLGVFLAVVGSLFALLISAYVLRAEMGDWQAVALPAIVWPNTLCLLIASLALEWARVGITQDDLARARTSVLVASAAALAFLAGQLFAWRLLAAGGYFVNSNPAVSFFYLMTAAHGLHVIGGMFALARTFERIWNGDKTQRIRLSVELAATYWLFMLFVWVILLLVLSGWAGEFLSICGQILSGSGIG
ncbi:cytochrome c oxidase subunit 3 [Devosia nitrariae]|uniref:Cytochrome-c oxidase n=1 Tax=Devosia nitrariae TaxID=2071872 RepID=A0ABQ5W949_9HYPH|nr:cytochrome c oxidase subunit 3 [Devosia nitrariae]GLQ56377.1 cytochrome-c oxidase [Devosia nitrariae]